MVAASITSHIPRINLDFDGRNVRPLLLVNMPFRNDFQLDLNRSYAAHHKNKHSVACCPLFL